jgi:glycosyltransferase involved in cell wall biosynthesis
MPTTSVFIPSYRRPGKLAACLTALAQQTVLPNEVLVVWQGDDRETHEVASRMSSQLPYRLVILHSSDPGIISAENLALRNAMGDVIYLIDDDAIPPPAWLERFLRSYADPTVGAVGGPFDNYGEQNSPYARQETEPVARLTWFGKMHGNIHSQVLTWRDRPPSVVDHLAGGNMSFRRMAFDRFESGLRPYWQLFELDVCCQVKARGYRILFDYGNVVDHFPTNTACAGGRHGDLQVKIYNPSYNAAFILARYTRGLLRAVRLSYLLLIGSVGAPGLLAAIVAWRRYGDIGREISILFRTWAAVFSGWRAGSRRPCIEVSPLDLS